MTDIEEVTKRAMPNLIKVSIDCGIHPQTTLESMAQNLCLTREEKIEMEKVARAYLWEVRDTLPFEVNNPILDKPLEKLK